MSSILNDTKHQLGLLPSDDSFDNEIIIHINSALAILTQLGVGPVQGYQITDAEQQWSELTGDDPRLNVAKTYVYLKTRLAFDPPQPSAIASFERQLEELVYRINVVVDYG